MLNILRILTMQGEKDNSLQYVSTSSVKSSLQEVSLSHQSDYSLPDILFYFRGHFIAVIHTKRRCGKH